MAPLYGGELDFPGARSIAMITREREEKKTGKSSTETVACISNLLNPSCEQFAAGVRRHWSIETIFHKRDATLLEDRHRMHVGNGPLNFALLRSFAISVGYLIGVPCLPDAAHRFRLSARSFLTYFQADPLVLAA